MPYESFVIEFDGEEDADLYEDLITLEVELCDEAPASFRLLLGMPFELDGTWRYLDDERFRIWSPVTIRVGFVDSGHDDLISGYITNVKPSFDPDEARSTLELTGLDASVLMDREEKLKDWPNKKDSDVASEIFGLYGFTPEVEDTAIIHDEALSTVIQRETDYQFLKRLALRNGFDCYVEGTTGYFQPVPADDAPQPLLAANFGEETNLRYFKATVDALRPANVAMFQIDRLNKETLVAEIETSAMDPLGELDAAALLPTGIEAGRVFVAKNAATGMPEMEALCQGLFHEGAWLVSGEGEVDAAVYGHVLRSRGLVTIKGVGESYSGVYYVSFTQHTFTREGYTQYFRVKRDALLPTGDEDFASDGGLLGGLL